LLPSGNRRRGALLLRGQERLGGPEVYDKIEFGWCLAQQNALPITFVTSRRRIAPAEIVHMPIDSMPRLTRIIEVAAYGQQMRGRF